MINYLNYFYNKRKKYFINEIFSHNYEAINIIIKNIIENDISQSNRVIKG